MNEEIKVQIASFCLPAIGADKKTRQRVYEYCKGLIPEYVTPENYDKYIKFISDLLDI